MSKLRPGGVMIIRSIDRGGAGQLCCPLLLVALIRSTDGRLFLTTSTTSTTSVTIFTSGSLCVAAVFAGQSETQSLRK